MEVLVGYACNRWIGGQNLKQQHLNAQVTNAFAWHISESWPYIYSPKNAFHSTLLQIFLANFLPFYRYKNRPFAFKLQVSHRSRQFKAEKLSPYQISTLAILYKFHIPSKPVCFSLYVCRRK